MKSSVQKSSNLLAFRIAPAASVLLFTLLCGTALAQTNYTRTIIFNPDVAQTVVGVSANSSDAYVRLLPGSSINNSGTIAALGELVDPNDPTNPNDDVTALAVLMLDGVTPNRVEVLFQSVDGGQPCMLEGTQRCIQATLRGPVIINDGGDVAFGAVFQEAAQGDRKGQPRLEG